LPFLAVILALATLAPAASSPPKKGSPQEDPREKDLIAALPDEDRRWLVEFVAPIILPEERKTYLELTESYQRADFREQFWQRRELPDLPPLLGPGYRYRYRELRELAESRYDGWRSDAGRMVIRFGEPSEILIPRCQGDETFRDLELWTYASLGTSGRGRRQHIFFRPYAGSPRKLWSLLDPDSNVFLPNGCREKFLGLRKDCERVLSRNDRCFTCDDRCRVFLAWEEIVRNQGNGAGALVERASLLEPQGVSTEGLARDRDKWATTAKRGAKKIEMADPAGSSAVASTTPAPAATAPPQAPSGTELARMISQLDGRYRDFLDLALPLMSQEELVAFVRMPNAEKDAFMREFWARSTGPDDRRRPRTTPEPSTTRMGISVKTTPTPI